MAASGPHTDPEGVRNRNIRPTALPHGSVRDQVAKIGIARSWGKGRKVVEETRVHVPPLELAPAGRWKDNRA